MGTAGLVLIAVIAAVAITSGQGDAVRGAPATQTSTAEVEQGELSAVLSLNGTLTYRARPDGSAFSAINHSRGIFTALPETGDRVGCGDVFYRVDDEPVLLLCGSVPTYRDLRLGDAGSDVRQLNRNLHALGCDAAAKLKSSERGFSWKTAKALRKLQHHRGAHETGGLTMEDAVVLPTAARIAKVTAPLGGTARPGATVAESTSDTLEVQVALAPSQQGTVQRGDRARITLPSNRSVKGTVDRLGRVARAEEKDGEPGAATVPASIRLDRPDQATGLDRAPVQVEIATKGIERALSVPVTALVGQTGGGSAVEVVRGDGRRELVAVTLGLFDTTAGRVQVDGRVRPGDLVVVPSP